MRESPDPSRNPTHKQPSPSTPPSTHSQSSNSCGKWEWDRSGVVWRVRCVVGYGVRVESWCGIECGNGGWNRVERMPETYDWFGLWAGRQLLSTPSHILLTPLVVRDRGCGQTRGFSPTPYRRSLHPLHNHQTHHPIPPPTWVMDG